jgi:hypothetical protein
MLVFVVRALAAGGPDGLVTAAKSLHRFLDPVEIRTGTLVGVTDHATASYRLYAARHGSLEPIPYQFDQRGADGEITLSEDGREAEFGFDADDDLVFMAKDTGDRVLQGEMPTGGDSAMEIDVIDPRSGAHGWAYLVHFAGRPPARSPVRYVTFDPERQEARALSYEVSYSHDASNALDGVRVPRSAGGTGETVIAGVSMRIKPTFFLFGMWPMALTERNFSVVPDGLKNGPVRAIRRVRQSLDLGTLFPDLPNGRVNTFYYASSFTTPSTFSIPWLVLKALRDFHFESIDEFGSPGPDMRYWDAENPEGVSFTEGGRPAGVDGDHDWWVVSGRRGTFLHALAIPKEWRAWGIRRGIVFRDRAATPGARTQDAGAGYSLLDMMNLRHAGDYELDSMFVVLPQPYRPGDEAEALATSRVPLETTVQAAPLEDGFSRHASAAH